MFLKILTLFNLFTSSFSQDICRSDTNGDGLVNVGDLLNILSDFSTTNLQSDVNEDSIVDVNDLLIVLNDFGEECGCQCCPIGAECFAPDPPCCAIPCCDEECSLGQNCGNQVWQDCGTSCPLICGQIEPMICNMMCNVGYQCNNGLWWDDETKMCVENTDCSDQIELPPDIAIGRPFIDKKLLLSESIGELNDWSSL